MEEIYDSIFAYTKNQLMSWFDDKKLLSGAYAIYWSYNISYKWEVQC